MNIIISYHCRDNFEIALFPLFYRYTFASGSADNIKQWMFPDGNFIQNLSGHNAIINTLAVNSDGVLVSGGNNHNLHCYFFLSSTNKV